MSDNFKIIADSKEEDKITNIGKNVIRQMTMNNMSCQDDDIQECQESFRPPKIDKRI